MKRFQYFDPMQILKNLPMPIPILLTIDCQVKGSKRHPKRVIILVCKRVIVKLSNFGIVG